MNAVLELRRKAGLTQELLSKVSGVKRSTISHYENGHSSPRLETLERLAGAVGLVVEVRIREAAQSTEG